MDEDLLVEQIEQLKHGSRTAVYNTLSTIRKEVIVTEAGIKLFKRSGGLLRLVFLLHKPNERITDVVLSILANCCMYLECAQEVEKLNGIRYVLHIIKNIAKDSILCRGCRVIGNIAQHESLVESLHQYGTSTAISSLLESETGDTILSPPTKLMAVRALRLLWTNPLRQQHMLSHNIPKIVASILAKHKDSWRDRPAEKELLIGVLRCILYFTESPSHDLVQQIIAGENGFQAIVSLISLQPYIATKCITNLATVATARSQLGTSDATDILIERLSACMETNIGCSWPREELSALCLLCRHAATRDEVRSKNGLSILLSVVKDSSDKDQQGQVLHALLYFIYDETSLQILISEGLVAILINCFSQFLLDMKCHHDINPKRVGSVSNKRELERPSSKRLLKKKSPVLKRAHEMDIDESSNDFKRLHRSEDSSSPTLFDARLSSPSSSCYSPDSSPLRYSMDGDSDSDDSVRYSPVCSESEAEDEKSNSELKFANFENEDFVHFEMGSNELESALEEETRPKIGEAPTLSWLLVLLSRASYMEEVDTRLAHSDTIDILLRYMQMSSYPVTRAARILFRIISRWDFLITLLRYNSVMKIYKLLHNLPHGEVCTQCNELKKFLQMVFSKLTCIAESGYGKGQIAHCLLRDEEIKNIVVTLPYLIQSRSLIRSFFNSCRGLKKLLAVVADRPNSIWNDAVNSLGMLATKLKIKNPLTTETFRPTHKISCDYNVNLTDKDVITFELDDRNRVDADKRTLTQHSPFFKALLEGGRFRESGQDIIHLGDVTKNGFIYLLNLLEYSSRNEEDSFPLCVTLSVALEVLVLADRYLLEDLTDLLTQAILKNYLMVGTVAEVYKWSLQSGTDILRVESIAYGLVGEMTDDDRVSIFNEIMADGFSDHFLKDCRFLLHRHLNIV